MMLAGAFLWPVPLVKPVRGAIVPLRFRHRPVTIAYIARSDPPNPRTLHPILRNILAVLAGLVVGGFVNMGLIILGGKFLPPPAGVDVNDIASINAHIGEYSVLQLMAPFIAHAAGVLVGAFLAAKPAASRHLALAMIIGAFFMLGGIMAVRMIPNAPVWFSTLDLVVAYLPMAWIGYRLAAERA